jgi:hypothetical protein
MKRYSDASPERQVVQRENQSTPTQHAWTVHTRAAGGGGPFKGNVAKCQCWKKFKINRFPQKFTDVTCDVAKASYPFQQSDVGPFVLVPRESSCGGTRDTVSTRDTCHESKQSVGENRKIPRQRLLTLS